LCNRVVKFYSYKGDLVFDPFAGSGTFGKSARNLERHFFLTEQEERYIERIRQEVGGRSLFAEGAVRILDTAAFRKLAAEQNGNDAD
jgi:DNA modification methylase